MKKYSFIFAILLAPLALWTDFLFADTVELKSGRDIQGEIIEVNDNYIILYSSSMGRQKFKRKYVREFYSDYSEKEDEESREPPQVPTAAPGKAELSNTSNYFKQKKIFTRVGIGMTNITEQANNTASGISFGTNEGSLPMHTSWDLIGLSFFNNTCSAALNVMRLDYGLIENEAGKKSSKRLLNRGTKYDCGLKFIGHKTLTKLRFGASIHDSHLGFHSEQFSDIITGRASQEYIGTSTGLFVGLDWHPFAGPINLSLEAALSNYDLRGNNGRKGIYGSAETIKLNGYSLTTAFGLAL